MDETVKRIEAMSDSEYIMYLWTLNDLDPKRQVDRMLAKHTTEGAAFVGPHSMRSYTVDELRKVLLEIREKLNETVARK